MRHPRNRAIVALSEAGWTDADIGRLFYLSVWRVRQIRTTAGIKRPINTEQTARNQRMAELYRSGKTLQEIGIEFGISRERVRQCIADLGVTEGGAALRARTRESVIQEERRRRLDARTMKLYGCDHETAVTINKGIPLRTYGSPACAYVSQRSAAIHRGLSWGISFPEWWRIWQESGKWDRRGRGARNYCMGRIEDAVGYEPGNIKIITNQENISESYIVRPADIRRALVVRKSSSKCVDAFSLKQQGLTNAEIAEKLGISRNCASQYVCIGRRIHRDQAVESA